MQRNLRRYANKKYPKIPKTVEDVIDAYKDPAIVRKYGRNLRNTEEFYIDTVQINPNSAFTVFASHQILNLVNKYVPFDEQFILMDGTFDVTPIGYYQLLVIYIKFKNDVSSNNFDSLERFKLTEINIFLSIQVFPMFHVLMSGKESELYKEVFDFIEERKLFKINPTASFMLDFEAGMRKAIKERFPKSKLHGCWYHFMAALRRKFRSLHMLRLIADDENANKIYRKLLSLPLLPSDSIENGYDEIKIEARKRNLHKEFRRFFSYFENFWLKLVSFCILTTAIVTQNVAFLML